MERKWRKYLIAFFTLQKTQWALGYQPHPSKTPPSSFLNQQTVQAPLFRQSIQYNGFSSPLLKVGSFSEPPPPPKKNFFSSVIPSYLLKITKFLGKISQFEFLVMREKNILAYKLFLSLNISDFNSFLCENCNPP